jgi:glutamine amidotransferase
VNRTAPTIPVVRTGTANTASVMAALRRLGAEPELTADAAWVREAERLVLPGVGAFAAAMDELGRAGLVEPLRERLRAGRATLCICLGLQLLAESSEESPGATGLAVMPGAQVTRLAPPAPMRVPQLGWNLVTPAAGARFLNEQGYAYYANSFALHTPPEGWACATTEHGARFVAAAERGGVLACQFHPELSGAWGLALIGRWMKESAL